MSEIFEWVIPTIQKDAGGLLLTLAFFGYVFKNLWSIIEKHLLDYLKQPGNLVLVLVLFLSFILFVFTYMWIPLIVSLILSLVYHLQKWRIEKSEHPRRNVTITISILLLTYMASYLLEPQMRLWFNRMSHVALVLHYPGNYSRNPKQHELDYMLFSSIRDSLDHTISHIPETFIMPNTLPDIKEFKLIYGHVFQTKAMRNFVRQMEFFGHPVDTIVVSRRYADVSVCGEQRISLKITPYTWKWEDELLLPHGAEHKATTNWSEFKLYIFENELALVGIMASYMLLHYFLDTGQLQLTSQKKENIFFKFIDQLQERYTDHHQLLPESLRSKLINVNTNDADAMDKVLREVINFYVLIGNNISDACKNERKLAKDTIIARFQKNDN